MSDQERKARRGRLDALRDGGVDPYPARVGPWTPVAEIHERFASADGESLEADRPAVAIVGRVMASRSFGKLMFLRVVEGGVSIQVSAKKGVSLYGIRRFPVTFYADEWEKILGMTDEIQAFIRENTAELKRK